MNTNHICEVILWRDYLSFWGRQYSGWPRRLTRPTLWGHKSQLQSKHSHNIRANKLEYSLMINCYGVQTGTWLLGAGRLGADRFDSAGGSRIIEKS